VSSALLQGSVGGGLRRNALTAADVIAVATATYAPTAALYYNTPFAAGFAPGAVPFAFMLATIAMLAVAICMRQLALRMASAGGYYSWVRGALGQRIGFLVGWLVLLGPFMVLPAVYAGASNYISTVLDRYGLHLDWFVIAVVLLVLVTALNVVGVRPSVRTGFVVLVVELSLVVIMCLVIVAQGGAEGNTLAPLTPNGIGLGGIAGAMVFGVLSFIGFEAVATTGEEADRPRSTIPTALLVGVIIGGVFLTFGSYAVTIGFGLSHTDQLASNFAPFDTLGQRYGNSFLRAGLDLAGVTSFFASLLLTTLAVSRIYFAMARDQILPSSLAVVSERYKTPATAVAAVGVLSLVVFTVLGIWVGPSNTYGYLGTVLTFAVVPVYVLIMVSTIVVFRTSLRDHFNPLLHLILPLAGIGIIAYPLWALSPLGGPEPAPFNFLPLVVVIYAVVGIAVSYILGTRLADAERAIARATFEEETSGPESAPQSP
jgi:amino acid transporter